MGVDNKPYPQEHLDWLKEYYPTHTLKDTHEAFNKHFGLNLTISSVKHRVRKAGVSGTHNTKFSKGHRPWNDGIKISEVRPDIYAKYFENGKGYFKKGFVVRKPVGTISVSCGQHWIKIAEPDVWQQYSRYVWEHHYNVKLSPKDKLLHLDRNPFNDSIENLVLVNNAILVRLWHLKHEKTDDPDINRIYVDIAKMNQMIKEKEEEK